MVNIIGGGLAGTEAAYQLSKRGIKVNLFEMRPKTKTEVHKTSSLSELVCSNSLKSTSLENAVGILKEELSFLDSLIIKSAYKFRVPAGGALAVDREKFSSYITEIIENEPNINLVRKEIKEIDLNDDNIWVIASGPLTSESLYDFLANKFKFMYFFDAVSPIITKESINFEKVFYGSRYNKGGDDYINCPMTKQEYEKFYNAIVEAGVIEEKDFEKKLLFERCQPIEEIARSGIKAMSFGPLKPVGFVDPKTNKRPYAIVQLRPENIDKTLYELVGFQTRLRWPEQKKVFRLIPGLENAEFVRYGVMHKNIYINSPKALDIFMRSKLHQNVFFAGQITGVEGYVESTASGLYVGINLARILSGKEPIVFPKATVLGSLMDHIINQVDKLKPMYANFGIMGISKNERKTAFQRSKLALENLKYTL